VNEAALIPAAVLGMFASALKTEQMKKFSDPSELAAGSDDFSLFSAMMQAKRSHLGRFGKWLTEPLKTGAARA
jgi:hypothetical protein